MKDSSTEIKMRLLDVIAEEDQAVIDEKCDVSSKIKVCLTIENDFFCNKFKLHQQIV